MKQKKNKITFAIYAIMKILINKVFILGFIILCFLLLIGGYLYLPVYIQKNIVPLISKKLGEGELSCKVYNVGFFSADLGDILLEKNKRKILSAKSLHIEYSLASLLDYEIKKISISGLVIIKNFSEEPLKKVVSVSEIQPIASSKKSEIPNIKINSFEITNSIAVIDYKSNRLLIPFDAKINLEKGLLNDIDINLNIYPKGQKIAFSTTINLNEPISKVAIYAEKFDLEYLKPFTENLKFNYQGQTKINALLCLNNTKVESVDVNFFLDDFLFDGYNTKVKNYNTSAQININYDNKNLTVNSKNLIVENDCNIIIDKLSLSLQKDNNSYNTSVNILTSLTSNENIILQKDFQSKLLITGKLSNNKDWNMSAEVIPIDENINVNVNNMSINSSVPRIMIKANGNLYKGILEISTNDFKCNVKQDNKDIAFNDFSLKTNLEFDIQNKFIEINSNLKGSKLNVKKKEFKVTIEDYLLFNTSTTKNLLRWDFNNSSTFEQVAIYAKQKEYIIESKIKKINTTTNGVIKEEGFDYTHKSTSEEVAICANDFKATLPNLKVFFQNKEQTKNLSIDFSQAELLNTKKNIKITNISALLPLLGNIINKGFVKIENINYDAKDIGRLDLSIKKRAEIFDINGVFKTDIIEKLAVDLSATLSLEKSPIFKLNYNIPKYHIETPLDLGQYNKQCEDIFIDGEFVIDGELKYSSKGITTSLKTKIINTNVDLAKNDITINGINATLEFSDLINLKTPPCQKISFNKLELGFPEAITNGELTFQVESLDQVFLENLSLKWCGGNIASQPARFMKNKSFYDILLYCDSLELERILKCFDVAKGKSEGKLNGKLLFRLKENKIIFNDGFLYSIPGVTGNLNVECNKNLLESMPKESPQFNLLDLTQEALKDFSYDWVKLYFDKNGDDELVLKMNLSGKPNNILPFTVTKQGVFIRDKVGAKFEGIVLNVNFPLNKTMKLGYEIFNKIQK